MERNESGGLESPERSHASNINDGLAVRYTPDRGPPRKLRFDPRSDGSFYRVDKLWTGCTWRPTGSEIVDDLALECGESIPEALAQPVLEQLFREAFAAGTITEVDVLNTLARQAFADATVTTARNRAESSNRGEQ